MNNPIYSDRSDPDFVDTASFTSHKVILTHKVILEITQGHFGSFRSFCVILGHSLGHRFSFTVWQAAVSKSISELMRMFL